MINIKKLGVMSLATFAFVPLANADTLYSFTETKVDNESVSMNLNVQNDDMSCTSNCEKHAKLYFSGYPTKYNKENEFKFTLKGNEFSNDADYNITITKGSTIYNETKKGSAINEGVSITLSDAKGEYILKVKDISNNEFVEVTDTNNRAKKTIIAIDDQGVANEEFDTIFEKYFKNGEFTANFVEPPVYTMLMSDVFKEYTPKEEGYEISISPETDEKWDDPELFGYKVYIMNSQTYKGKNYVLKVKFKEKDTSVLNLIEDIRLRLSDLKNDFKKYYDKRFIIEDLDSINYYYSVKEIDDPMVSSQLMANYSRKLHEFANDMNIDFLFNPGAGGGVSEFTDQIIGVVNILYKGEVYGAVDPLGFNFTNVLYVPSDTENDADAYKEAALKRINEYLKGVDVTISVGGNIADLGADQNVWESIDGDDVTEYPLVDITKTCGKWFNVKIGDYTYKYFIVADSDKMEKPFIKTKDINTNICIVSDGYDVPLDSTIRVNVLDENSDEYKELAKKLNIIKGMAYDLNLFSYTKDMYIKKTEDGKFKVYIPVSEELTKKKLAAVYTKEDGSTEEHQITFEGNYAVFETDHFSTYAIVDKGNPKTGDNVVLYLLVLTSSGYALYKARKFN